jgi:hypothetical protein
MSNIYSSSDDDIFEDYVENKSESHNSFSSEDLSSDKVFPEIDSPFQDLLKSSTLKVNFGEAFYEAAHEWTNQGYREANGVSILEALAELTNGKFVYSHRLITSKEILSRKKTIIKFLTLILEDDSVETVIKISGKDSNVKFNQTYFSMFFRSFYNIQLHTYYCELAVYKSLSEILNTPLDQNLVDPHSESQLPVINSTEHINNLYIKYFEKDDLAQKIESYMDEIIQNKTA